MAKIDVKGGGARARNARQKKIARKKLLRGLETNWENLSQSEKMDTLRAACLAILAK